MDRREQRFKKRTAVTKEQTLNFLCANEAAEQSREAHQCGERNSKGITQPSGAATPMNCVNPPLAGSHQFIGCYSAPTVFTASNLKAFSQILCFRMCCTDQFPAPFA